MLQRFMPRWVARFLMTSSVIGTRLVQRMCFRLGTFAQALSERQQRTLRKQVAEADRRANSRLSFVSNKE